MTRHKPSEMVKDQKNNKMRFVRGMISLIFGGKASTAQFPWSV